MSREGMSPFNPSDPKYKRVEDLPEAFQGDYVNSENGEGFIPKEAHDTYIAAQRTAYENARAGKLDGTTPFEILREQAETYDAVRTSLLGQLEAANGALSRAINFDEIKAEIYANPGLASDKTFMLKFAERSRLALDFAPPELRNDKDVVLVAVENGTPLDSVSETLLQDRDVIIAAARAGTLSGSWSRPIPSELKQDPEVIIEMVKSNPNVIRYLEQRSIPVTKELALLAVQEGADLADVGKKFQDDKDVVLAGVAQEGQLSFVSDRLRDDKDVVLASIAGRVHAPDAEKKQLLFCSERLANDREVVVAATEAGVPVPLGKALRNDLELAYLMLERDVGGLWNFSDEVVWSNKDFVMEAIKHNPLNLKYAAKSLKDDAEVVKSATDAQADLIKYASERVKRAADTRNALQRTRDFLLGTK